MSENNLEEHLEENNKKDKVKNLTNKLLNKLDFKEVTIVILSILLLITSVGWFIESNSKTLVVGLDPSDIPRKLNVYKQDLRNYINFKSYTIRVLTSLYSWDKNSYVNNIEDVKKLMTPQMIKEYEEKIQNGIVKSIAKDNIVSSIHQIRIINDETNYLPEKNMYKITAKALRNKMVDFVREPTENLKVSLYVKETEVSNDNIWGLKLVRIEER